MIVNITNITIVSKILFIAVINCYNNNYVLVGWKQEEVSTQYLLIILIIIRCLRVWISLSYQLQRSKLANGGPDVETGSAIPNPQGKWHSLISRIFIQAFTLTFLAEWGDRSQLTTIILAAREVCLNSTQWPRSPSIVYRVFIVWLLNAHSWWKLVLHPFFSIPRILLELQWVGHSATVCVQDWL